MNFLAHAHLSGGHPDIIIGNLIGDTVKGHQYEAFPQDIRLGVLLHRAIDAYTDAHPEFKASVATIKPDFRRYSGIVCDIYYDHFLAKHWLQFSERPLAVFVNDIYLNLIKTVPILSERARRITSFMILRDWLGTYGNLDILHQIFLGMHYRTGQRGHMDKAASVLEQHYQTIEQQFLRFMPDVEAYAESHLKQLLEQEKTISSTY